MPIDETAVAELRGLHPGGDWLDGLPLRLAEAERRYRITVGTPFPARSYNSALDRWVRNYVAPVVGASLVAKFSRPGDREARSEVAALLAFAGQGAVKVLCSDEALGLVLIERLEPGTSIASLPDEASTAVAANLLGRLHQATAPPSTIALGDWFAGLWAQGELLWPGAVRRAKELLASTAADGILHGDLHHDNVLLGADGWTSIDPKGLVGDPAFDAVTWLANQVDPTDPVGQGARRAQTMGQALGCPPSRIVAWGVVQSVLSACWSVEDGVDPALDLAQARRVVAFCRR